MATDEAKGTGVPAKNAKREAAETLVALMAPGKAVSQMNVGADADGEPNMIVIYLTASAV